MPASLFELGISGQVGSIVIGHTILTTPFAMAVIRLRLHQMDPSLEAAARNPGVSEWRALRSVALPVCRPAIVAAPCLTVAVGFDAFAAGSFVAGLNKTLPVQVLGSVPGNTAAQVNAIGSFVFLMWVALVVSAQLFLALELGRAA